MNVIERNNVKVSGQGEQVIIFAHGYGCDQNMWKRVTPAFEKDYQIVTFDHVGAGKSDTSAYDRTKYSTLRGYAQDVLEICKALDVTDAIFVGHSVSSMIGVLAASEEPHRFSKLVLVGPSPCYVNDGDYVGGFTNDAMDELLKTLSGNFTQWATTMAPVIMGSTNNPELGVELAQSFCSAKPEIAIHFAQVVFLSDNRKDLNKLTTPSLILQCSDDPVAPVAVGHYLHKHLKGSEFVQLKATGHCPHMSAPEETVQAIKAYLKGA